MRRVTLFLLGFGISVAIGANDAERDWYFWECVAIGFITAVIGGAIWRELRLERPRDAWTMVGQVLLGAMIAAPVWIATEGEWPQGRALLSLAVGSGGLYLLNFLYVWARHGWAAARSMRL